MSFWYNYMHQENDFFSISDRFKKERHVNLSQIQPCHMIEYETKILLLFSSYGCISERSKTDFTDLNALEKHIMHKFVRGKPIIVIKHQDMLVTYKQDVDISTAKNIAAVREKVTPQVRHSAIFYIVYLCILSLMTVQDDTNSRV